MGEELKQEQVPEELRDENLNLPTAQEPASQGTEQEPEPQEPEEQGGQEPQTQETGQEQKKDENYVPQSRFDEIYKKLKETERRIQAMEETKTPPITTETLIGDEIGKVNVKEILNLTEEQAKKLEEWYEQDPISAQAWVNQKVSDVRRQYEYLITTQERHKRELMRRHPDMYKVDEKTGQMVLDPNTPKGKIFAQIAEENPYLVNIPDGPKIAMIMMEERLKEMGGSEMEEKKDEKKVQTGEQKAQQSQAQSQPPKPKVPIVSSKPSVEGKKSTVKLTPEEKRVAAKFGMTEEEYIKYKG